MSVKSYDDVDLRVIESKFGLRVPQYPGQLVAHYKDKEHSRGIIVAYNRDRTATVLWSVEPRIVDPYFFAPYVPLQVTPTMFFTGSHVPMNSLPILELTGFTTGSHK